MRVYFSVATRDSVMDRRFGMPHVFVPGTFFLLKISQAVNALRHLPETRAKLIANNVLVEFMRLLIALGAAQSKSGNLDNALPDNRGERNSHLGRHDRDSLHDAKTLLFRWEHPAHDNYVWRSYCV